MNLPKSLSLAAAAAALAAPGSAVAATSTTGSSSVTADVANTLEATFPGAYAWGDLNAGTAGNESSAQTTTVKSNAAWGLKISSDIASGKMTEWDGGAYVASSPKVLANALQWKLGTIGGAAQSSSYASLSSTKALVTGSQSATNDSGSAIGVLYKQVISYVDAAAGANDYRIAVNYDASQGY